jgi:hypothetical protein
MLSVHFGCHPQSSIFHLRSPKSLRGFQQREDEELEAAQVRRIIASPVFL